MHKKGVGPDKCDMNECRESSSIWTRFGLGLGKNVLLRHLSLKSRHGMDTFKLSNMAKKQTQFRINTWHSTSLSFPVKDFVRSPPNKSAGFIDKFLQIILYIAIISPTSPLFVSDIRAKSSNRWEPSGIRQQFAENASSWASVINQVPQNLTVSTASIYNSMDVDLWKLSKLYCGS